MRISLRSQGLPALCRARLEGQVLCVWSYSASLLPDPLQPPTPVLQKGGLTPKPSELTLTHPHSQFQLNQESTWTNMLEKK